MLPLNDGESEKLMIGQWDENENLFEYIKQKLTDS